MPEYMRRSPSEVHPRHYRPPQSARHVAAIVPPVTRAAANAQSAAHAQGPNPLWAINIGMAAFFAAAALVMIFG